MKKGFTLLELIVVIIIIGILASLAFVQYTKVIEKSRTAEAKTTLGQIRTAQEVYKQESGSYTTTMGNLATDVTESVALACVDTNHYFNYSVATANKAIATRCTSTGKTPNAAATYSIELTYSTGVWSGTAGYY